MRLPGAVWFIILVTPRIIHAQTNEAYSPNEPVICDCGFKDESNNVWANIWHADYSTYKSNLRQDSHYMLMDYTVDAKHNNTLSRVFTPNNVKLSADKGIVLAVERDDHGKYSSASIGTKRDDFLYGTFRARLKTSNVPGTVAAFFYYRNNTSEIDIEMLSRLNDPYMSYFSVQPQVYESNGQASALTNNKHPLNFNPTEDYHTYRFDWTPGSVKFYVDDEFIYEMTTSVPSSPGRILLNHWTDGNPTFSGGPPTEAAELALSRLNIFFNSSESDNSLQCQKSKSACLVSDIMSNTLYPGDSKSSDASSSQSYFFSPNYLTILIVILLYKLI